MTRIGWAVLLSAVLYSCAPFPRYGHNDSWTSFCVATLAVGTPLCMYWVTAAVFGHLRRLRSAGDAAEPHDGLRRRLASAASILFLAVYLLALVQWAAFIREVVERSRVERACSDIRNLDLAYAKLLDDARAKSLLDCFDDPDALPQHFGTYANAWTFLVPELLRDGCNAKTDLKPEIRTRLAASYIHTGNDPWGHPYHFFAGPLDAAVYDDMALASRFRSYRKPTRTFYIDRNGYQKTIFYYDAQARQEEVTRLGTETRVPEPDGLPGFPAPADLRVYIWSMGADGKSCQRIGADQSPESVHVGPAADSGDDINNWDSQRGWQDFYGGKR